MTFIDDKPTAVAAIVSIVVAVGTLVGADVDPADIVPVVGVIVAAAVWLYRRVTSVPEGERGFKPTVVTHEPETEPARDADLQP